MRDLTRSIIALSLLLGPSGFVHAQDDCSSPVPISGEGSFDFDPTGATDSNFFGGAGVCTEPRQAHDVFLVWTPQVSGRYRLIACSPDVLGINLYVGADCNATCASDDALIRCDDGSLTNDVRIDNLVAGAQYLIQVGGLYTGQAATGPGVLEIYQAAIPVNDACATATAITGIGSYPYDRTGATDTSANGGYPSESCGGPAFQITRDVYFQWTAESDGDYLFDGVETEHAYITVRSGVGCGASCVTGTNYSTCTGAPGPEPTFKGVQLFGVQTGDTYLVQLASSRAMGTQFMVPAAPGTLEVSFRPAVPSNDEPAGAIPVTGLGTTPFDVTWATETAPLAPVGCGANTNSQFRDVFFQWTAEEAGDISMGADEVGGRYQISLYEGTPGNYTCFDSSGSGERLIVEDVSPGDSFLVRVRALGDCEQATGAWSVLPLILPGNESCDAAQPLFGEVTVPFSTVGANSSLFDTADPCNNMVFECSYYFPFPCGYVSYYVSRDVFFTWTSGCTGTYRVKACAGPNDTVTLNVHNGSGCQASCLEQTYRPCTDGISFDAVAGETFTFQIADAFVIGELQVSLESTPCIEPAMTLVCDPASPHYLGESATLAASVTGIQFDSGLHLECTDGPTGEFGYFLIGSGADSPLAIFEGVLCLDAPHGRYSNNVADNQNKPQLNSVGQFDASGVMQNLAGTSVLGSGFDVPLELPYSPVGQFIVPGDSWSFQAWFRDKSGNPPVPGTANFSNALTVSFP